MSSRPRVLIADKTGQFVQDTLSKKYELHSDRSLSGEKLEKMISLFHPNVIVVRSTKLTAAHLGASDSLKIVVRAGAGTNTIDKAFASSKGIYVCNCPGKNAIAVAELAMAHLLNLDRRIANGVIDIRNGKWNKKEYGKAKGLCGRTLAVLGAAGAIGRNVCIRAKAFGLNVRGFDPMLTPQMAKEMGIVYSPSMELAVQDADAVTVHIPLLKATKHVINKQLIARMKDGGYLVNTSRGGVVKEADVLEMIKTKGIRYGCDVYENEPKASAKEFKDAQISSNANVYGTHHIGASTDQAAVAVGTEVMNVITSFLDKGETKNCVNLKNIKSKL
eukprot:200540_1